MLAEIADAGDGDIDLAVKAARRAFSDEWSKWKPVDRQRLLLKFADIVEARYDELASLDSLDYGGPISRTSRGRMRSPALLRFYAGLATSVHGETIENSLAGDYLTYTRREPVGVVGAIIPWNTPVGAAIWKIAPVLASGCTMVLKPSELASLSSLMLGDMLLEAGLPAGVVNVVTGHGAAGAALSAHPDVDKISFTGSTPTGQSIIRASAGTVKRLTLELGGKSPDIVFADADIEKAVAGVAMGAFANSGQICSAGTRLFVERKIFDRFMADLSSYAAKLRVGNSLDADTDLGPIVSERQLERVTSYIDIGLSEGAELVFGGTSPTGDGYANGYFMQPTIFGNAQNSRIMREEIFGPVISAVPFDTFEEVVRSANDTNYGLGAGVWTRDVGISHRMARAIQSGTVWVNCYNTFDPAVPFGGFKMSGYGRESGVHHLDHYFETKSVVVNLE